MRLFVERAREAQPRFRLAGQNAAAVALICVRLDGIPLALELAAARLRAVPIETLVARLGDLFRLLSGSSRSAPTSQQTISVTLHWSYALLSPRERRLARRLAVFGTG